jgi:preprotein translocase subunit SecB
MAENTTPPPAGGAPSDAPQAGAQAPRLTILSQYIKDLSFENPRAPASLEPGKSRPEIQVRVDARAQELTSGRYEVTFQLHCEARSGEDPVFMVELTYAGLFSVANVPPESLQPVLLIECPRLLFPFARRIVADATRDGGFTPLMIDPIDFVALYRRRQEQAQAAAQAAASAGGENEGASAVN